MVDNKYALWLPKNSIKAILAIMLTVAAITAIFKQVPEGALALLFGAAGTAWGFYYGKTTSEENNS